MFFVGRLVLVRHVFSSMPIHLALSIPIPIKVFHSIKKLFRNFFWSANPTQTKKNLINWKVVCLPKEEGDLGLRRVKEMNEAYMLRLGRLAMTSSSIWASWLDTGASRIAQFGTRRIPKYALVLGNALGG